MCFPNVQQYGDEVRVDRDLSVWRNDKARCRGRIASHHLTTDNETFNIHRLEYDVAETTRKQQREQPNKPQWFNFPLLFSLQRAIY